MDQDTFLKVIGIENLTESTYVLRFERGNIEFIPGQYICLGTEDYPFMREYSIYSSIRESFLEVLIKEVPDGDISKRLRKCVSGDKLRYRLSLASFINSSSASKNKIFIATGTGISPFHSYIKSIGYENCKIIHGVKGAREAYGKDVFNLSSYTLCTSRESSGNFNGRVTEYLKKEGFDLDGDYFLCGNGKMIYDVFDILQQGGVKADQVNYEIYF